MKNKFLVLAMATAILATFALPSVGFAATAGDASSEIGVTADTTLTIVLNGQAASATFAIDPFVANDTDSVVGSAASDAIVVTDYTGDDGSKNGHMISVGLHSNTWWYSGSASGVDVAVLNTAGTPGTDQLLFQMVTRANDSTFADVTEDTCTPSGFLNTVSASTTTFTVEETELVHNSEVCPGATSYIVPLLVTAPSNGLYEGSYTISGTYVVYDDTDTTL